MKQWEYGPVYPGKPKAISMLVFAIAPAPVGFSLSRRLFNNYTAMDWIGIVIVLFIALASIKANSPQIAES